MRIAATTVLGVFLVASVARAEPATETTTQAAGLFSRDTFRIDTIVCPFKGELEYEPQEIECGLLQVPENREDPESRYIELHFIKLNSTWDDDDDNEDDADDEDSDLAPGKRKDPVVYLTGGPGAHATGYAKRFKDHRIRKHRDLYILEQRGIGYSGDFCPHYSTRNPKLSNADSFDQRLKNGIRVASQCAAAAAARGVDLRGYNTIENARDVRALRQALGFKKWNVWGISYGSVLGQAYLKVDPDGIRAIALDAIVPLSARGDTTYWRIAHWYDRDLKKLNEACQANPTCAGAYPGLGDRVRQAAQALADNPLSIEVKDVERYPAGKIWFFHDIAAFLPFIFFYEQDNYAGLPGVIYAWADAVERRDPALFKAFAAVGPSMLGISQGMNDAIYCNDGYVEGVNAAAALDRKEHPLLASAMGTAESFSDAVEKCRRLDLPPQAAEAYEPVQTDIPALIIEGDMDPITPPPLAKAILPGFKNATYVEFPYAGHGPSRSVKCAGDMLNKFFDKPSDKPDLSCVEKMQAPAFYQLYTTTIAPRLLALVSEDKKAVAGPAAWLVGSVIVALVAFLVLTLSPLGRRIDGAEAAQTFGARWMAWLAATLAVVSVTVFAAAFYVTFEQSQMLLLFGLVSWARIGAVAGVLGGVAGLLTIALTLRARARARLPIGTLLGFILTGVASTALSAFLLLWDLGPL